MGDWFWIASVIVWALVALFVILGEPVDNWMKRREAKRYVADEIERLRCDLLMAKRRIDELAAEIDGYKEWLASNGFNWEEARRG